MNDRNFTVMSLADDRPRPVSRKTREDGVKKSFLFEP